MAHFKRPASPGGVRAASVMGAAVRRPWHGVVVLFAVLSFLMLLGTAATHHHTTLVGEHDCVTCSAVTDRIADIGFVPVIHRPAVDVTYVVLAAPCCRFRRSQTVLLPPGRGPPPASA